VAVSTLVAQITAESDPFERMRMLSTLLPIKRNKSSRPSSMGFSIVELLLSVVIGGLLLASISQVIISHIRASAQQVEIQRLRSSWRKFQDLLTTETQEAVEFSDIDNEVRLCAFQEGVDQLIIILTVPMYSDSFISPLYPDTVRDTRISYYQTINAEGVPEVRRCGPYIRADGSLDPSRYIGSGDPSSSNPADWEGRPGSLVLEGIRVNPAVIGPNRRSITISPQNTIENALTPFTASAKVIRTR
jgi:type II secretory pathway pseudopilin PulG